MNLTEKIMDARDASRTLLAKLQDLGGEIYGDLMMTATWRAQQSAFILDEIIRIRTKESKESGS